MKNVLILCTGNSCRSQMAEGLLRHLFGHICQVDSAGTHPSFVHPFAIRVMSEIGIDIATHHSKSVRDFSAHPMDLVITVCDNAKDSCPLFPGATQYRHWPFPDPAAAKGSDAEILAIFRQVRDLIQQKFKSDLPNILEPRNL